jgi:hypothetical protein
VDHNAVTWDRRPNPLTSPTLAVVGVLGAYYFDSEVLHAFAAAIESPASLTNWCTNFRRLIDKKALMACELLQCMDTFKDNQRLEELNDRGAPWKVRQQAPAELPNGCAKKVSARA